MVMFGGTPPVPMQNGSAPAGVAASPRTIVTAKTPANTTRRIISAPSLGSDCQTTAGRAGD